VDSAVEGINLSAPAKVQRQVLTDAIVVLHIKSLEVPVRTPEIEGIGTHHVVGKPKQEIRHAVAAVVTHKV